MIFRSDAQSATNDATRHVSSLRVLNLNWTSVEDIALQTILSHCQLLDELYLHGVNSLQNPDLEVGTNLKVIDFSGCHSLKSAIIRSPKRSLRVQHENCHAMTGPIEVIVACTEKATPSNTCKNDEQHKKKEGLVVPEARKMGSPVRRRLVF